MQQALRCFCSQLPCVMWLTGGGDTIDKPLTKEEVKLLEFLRSLQFGEVTIVVKDGKPVLGKQPLKSVKFDG